MPFQFRLQTTLQLRERERDEAAASHHQAQLALAELQRQFDGVRAEYSAQHPYQTEQAAGSVDPQKLLESQRFQMHLLTQLRTLQTQVSSVKSELESRRQELVRREQAVESLNRLKQRQARQWTDAQAKRTQAELDEWASQRIAASRQGTPTLQDREGYRG